MEGPSATSRVDLCERPETVPYQLGREDMAETVAMVEALDRRIIAQKADVRDLAAVQAVVDAGVSELGRLDIVAASAGISSRRRSSR